MSNNNKWSWSSLFTVCGFQNNSNKITKSIQQEINENCKSKYSKELKEQEISGDFLSEFGFDKIKIVTE